MSARSNLVPINKTSSSENVCKFKEDRSRTSANSFKGKQRYDSGNLSKYGANNYSCQPRNGRGQCNNYQKQPRSKEVWGGKRSKVTSEQRQEMGGKKVNLNHLLNFTYEHEEHFHSEVRASSRLRRTMRDSFYNKEQFIQANCQLIMKEGGSYDEHFVNFDLPVNWDEIEKVNIWRKEMPTCPICLSDFCAARMTKCGHIYCWPCILHYLALEEKSWRMCPICHEAIHEKDLKSVSVYPEKNVKVQSLITMRLMRRQKGSNISLPADNQLENLESVFVFDEKLNASEQRNVKYLVASPDKVLENVVKVEKSQLEFKLATELDEYERTFIQSALNLCKQRELSLLKSVESTRETEKKLPVVEKERSLEDPTKEQLCIDDEVTLKSARNTANEGACMKSEQQQGDDDIKDKIENRYYYYYQASDGQHVYLHPLHARCLYQHYGSYVRCPLEISAKILASEEFTMNENTRVRHRYLEHLPLSLEFCIIELDLRPPLVSPDTLASFQEAFDRRAAIRKKKVRDEKRILRKAQHEAMRKQGKYPSARICLENQQQFPQIQNFNASGSSYSALFPSPVNTPGNESVTPSTSVSSFSPEGSLVSSSSESGMSFAQMLKTSGCDESATWGKRSPHPAKQAPITEGESDLEDDDDNFAAPPTYQASFSDALSSAFDNLAAPSGGKSKKKGKKGKKLVLFSTSGQHH